MFSRIIRGTFMVSLIIFFVILISYFINNQEDREIKYYLEINNRKNDSIVVKMEVSVGDKFYLEYINSRDLNPIIDTFEIREDGIFCLLTEEYPWYGAGQECHTSKDIKYSDKLVIVNVNREMKILPLRVAFTVEQKIKYKEREFILSSLTDRGDPIDIIIATEGGMNDK
ncbi:DUF1850 domain-containing protein [bacterium]|nr:DUF1850 domain-containing protein [Candidatus Atribacteria bacterium]MBU4047849.1 DUF1850 domain-containing protein [bacterium]MBU4561907.1 DUF1850 domain-containing protein [bacterium]